MTTTNSTNYDSCICDCHLILADGCDTCEKYHDNRQLIDAVFILKKIRQKAVDTQSLEETIKEINAYIERLQQV